jgi:hypothetical protein
MTNTSPLRDIPVEVIHEPDARRAAELWRWLIDKARKARAAKIQREDDEAA